jgi:ribosome maturation factor RimP
VSSAALALAAAILHALWNLMLACSRDVLAATAVALGSSIVLATPFAVLTWGVEREAVPCSGSRAAASSAPCSSSRGWSRWARPDRPRGPGGCYTSGTTFHLLDEMGARRPFLLKGPVMSTTYEKERTLQRQIAGEVESALPGVEVLAVELAGPARFTVFVDHAGGVDHALCARVTDVLREYLREYAVDVSSPGLERPLRKPEHFRNAVGRKISLRTPERKRLQGEVVDAGETSVVVRTGDDTVEIPYDQVVRGNLVYEK